MTDAIHAVIQTVSEQLEMFRPVQNRNSIRNEIFVNVFPVCKVLSSVENVMAGAATWCHVGKLNIPFLSLDLPLIIIFLDTTWQLCKLHSSVKFKLRFN